MAENTGERTADLVNQTFEGFDSEMTAAPTENNVGKNEGDLKKKKLNQNLLIFGGVGIASVIVVGYMLLHKNPQQESQHNVLQKQVAQQPQVAQNVTPQIQNNQAPVAVAPAPVVQVDAQPVAQASGSLADLMAKSLAEKGSAVQPAQPAQPAQPVQQAQQKINSLPSGGSAPVVASLAPAVNAVAPVAAPTPVPVVKSPVAAPAPVVNAVGNQPAQQLALIQELKVMLEDQTKDLNNKFEEQRVFNTNIDKRISVLESKSSNSLSNEKHVVKHEVHHIAAKKVVVNKVTHKSSESHLEKVATEKATEISDGVKLPLSNVKAEETKTVYPKIDIYSIFSGRLWIKNPDGSLLTFTEGDSLPDGEIIQKISDEDNSVKTNVRTIK